MKAIAAVAGLIVVIFIVFWPSLFNGFINLDDTLLIFNNPLISPLDGQHLIKIFTTLVQQIYFPLTLLSFAIERFFFNLNPFLYHLDNLLLHMGVSTLIFCLCRKFQFSLRASLLAAMIFAIHPMHVESVDWIAERKDVLYSFFYLLSVYNYLRYCQTSRKGAYLLSLGFGLLSILSKPMALSLPFILFLLDWFQGRKFSRPVILEKIPFLTLILPLASISYIFHAHPSFNPNGGIFIWIWSFVFYLKKFLFPSNLMIMYFLPKPISLVNPEYAFALIAFLFFIFTLLYWRRNRLWIFACAYYFCSVFFLLRFNTVGDTSYVADHYMYLSSLGFCLFIGFHMDRMINGNKFTSILILLLFLALGIKTWTQHGHWKDEGSLLKYLYSQSDVYTMDIGNYYYRHGQYNLATEYYNKALGQKPDHDDLIYNTLGVMSSIQGKIGQAIDYYNKSINSNQQNPDAYLNLAVLEDGMGKYDLAFDNYSRAIQNNPYFAQSYHNRAIIYGRRGQLNLAIEDLTKAVRIIPDFWTAYYLRGQIYHIIGQPDKALADFEMVLKLKPHQPGAEKYKEDILSGNQNIRPHLDIPPDTYDQGPWKEDQYQNYLPDKTRYYSLNYSWKIK